MLSHFSRVRLSATPWTVAPQASLTMGFPRQEFWSGFPFPTPGDLPNPGMEPTSLMSPTLVGAPGKQLRKGSPIQRLGKADEEEAHGF